MSGNYFKSTGTISVRFELRSAESVSKKNAQDDGSPPLCGSSVYFTPNADSTVRFDGNQYAVFLPIGEGGNCLKRELLRDSGKGIEIKAKGDLSGLVSAAVQQTLVEVEVKEKDSSWVLHAITVPPPGKKK